MSSETDIDPRDLEDGFLILDPSDSMAASEGPFLAAKTGKKLFHFLAKLILDKFYGKVTIHFEHGKVPHVETESKRPWQHKDLSSPTSVSVHRELTGGKRKEPD